RMEVAGQRQPIFDTRAARVAYRFSRGVPRLLNTICDRSLLGAYATGRTRVTAAIVRRAAREVLGRPPRRRWIVATATAAVLVTPGGDTHHVVLTGLGGEQATLQIGERQVTLPTAEIERFWNGPFVLLWKPPAVGPVPLKPGMRGKDILWLRQRLGEIEGTA